MICNRIVLYQFFSNIKKNSKNKFKIKIFNKLNIFFSYVDILNHIIFK